VDDAGNAIMDPLELLLFHAGGLAVSLKFVEANNLAYVRASRLHGTVLFLNQDAMSPSGVWMSAPGSRLRP
jgi:hypothetical protein